MALYFNDHEPFVVDWLRALYPNAVVDGRDMRSVEPADLTSFQRVHLCAGIGGWEYALQLAGWPTDWPIWTASLPCQPFSGAGRAQGILDPRHLWPVVRRLIAECRPSVVFGEQVASPLGRQWLAGVRLDLEELGYAVGAADLCAASVGAPHIRQRLYWVADAQHPERGQISLSRSNGRDGADDQRSEAHGDSRARGEIRELGDAEEHRCRQGCENWNRTETGGKKNGFTDAGEELGGAGPWADTDWLLCRDGKARRIPSTESGIRPVADGIPGRVGCLRAYGNAIVPPLAARFIQAYLACRQDVTHGLGTNE